MESELVTGDRVEVIDDPREGGRVLSVALPWVRVERWGTGRVETFARSQLRRVRVMKIDAAFPYQASLPVACPDCGGVWSHTDDCER